MIDSVRSDNVNKRYFKIFNFGCPAPRIKEKSNEITRISNTPTISFRFLMNFIKKELFYYSIIYMDPKGVTIQKWIDWIDWNWRIFKEILTNWRKIYFRYLQLKTRMSIFINRSVDFSIYLCIILVLTIN